MDEDENILSLMKNKDIGYVKKIIEYCDIVDSLLDEYEMDYLVFQSSRSF